MIVFQQFPEGDYDESKIPDDFENREEYLAAWKAHCEEIARRETRQAEYDEWLHRTMLNLLSDLKLESPIMVSKIIAGYNRMIEEWVEVSKGLGDRSYASIIPRSLTKIAMMRLLPRLLSDSLKLTTA